MRKLLNVFFKISSLKDVGSVKFYYHPTLNLIKGTIFNRYLALRPVDYIVKNLTKDGVVDAYCTKRIIDGKEVATGLIILVFDKYDLPKEIDAGYEKCKVNPYFPNPLRCKKCQKIGHTTKWCRVDVQLCEKCAYQIPHEQCTRTYCVNCNIDTHASSDRNCPKFLSEKEILKIRTLKKCSIFEARKEYQASIRNRPLQPVLPDISFANVAKAGNTAPVIAVQKSFNFSGMGTPASLKVNELLPKKTTADVPHGGEHLPKVSSTQKASTSGTVKPGKATATTINNNMEIDSVEKLTSNLPRPQCRQNKLANLPANTVDQPKIKTIEPKNKEKRKASNRLQRGDKQEKGQSDSNEEDLTTPTCYLLQKLAKDSSEKEQKLLSPISNLATSNSSTNIGLSSNILNPIIKSPELNSTSKDPKRDPDIFQDSLREDMEFFFNYHPHPDKGEEG